MKALPATDPRSWQFQANIHSTLDPVTNPLFRQCEHGTLLFATTGPPAHVADVQKRRGVRLSASETEVASRRERSTSTMIGPDVTNGRKN